MGREAQRHRCPPSQSSGPQPRPQTGSLLLGKALPWAPEKVEVPGGAAGGLVLGPWPWHFWASLMIFSSESLQRHSTPPRTSVAGRDSRLWLWFWGALARPLRKAPPRRRVLSWRSQRQLPAGPAEARAGSWARCQDGSMATAPPKPRSAAALGAKLWAECSGETTGRAGPGEAAPPGTAGAPLAPELPLGFLPPLSGTPGCHPLVMITKGTCCRL